MERKIGEIFNCDGEWYQCIGDDNKSCTSCDMNFDGKCPISVTECDGSFRSDNSDVCFKKLEKVGEPYEHCGKLYQCYKLPMEIEIRLLPNNCNPIGKDNLVEIELKQNKEDMETTVSNDATKHSNFENIGKNLKPFDLEAAKSGKPVCTRDGRKARIICFDMNANSPIVALVDYNGQEVVVCCHNDGRNYHAETTYNDLMMLPEKKSGWVNIYKETEGEYYVDKLIHKTEKFAFDVACPDDYIGTVKIEWYE